MLMSVIIITIRAIEDDWIARDFLCSCKSASVCIKLHSMYIVHVFKQADMPTVFAVISALP